MFLKTGAMKTVINFLLIYFLSLAGGYPEECGFCLHRTCNPSMIGVPDIDFDPAVDSEELRKAITVDSNDNAITHILTARSESQRQGIVAEYRKHMLSLSNSLNSRLSGGFRRLMVALVTPLVTFYAKELRNVIEHNDRHGIVEILASLPPCMIQQITGKYQELYENRNLFEELNDYTFFDFMTFANRDYVTLVHSLASGDREVNERVNEIEAIKDAKRLKSAGINNAEKDVKVFIEIFTKRSIPQLLAIMDEYDLLRKQEGDYVSLREDIYNVFRTDSMRESIMAIIRNAVNQPMYFAEEIEKFLKLKWTSDSDEDKIIRIMRGRGDIDMEEIKIAYESRFRKSLADGIRHAYTFTTRFPRALLSIINWQN